MPSHEFTIQVFIDEESNWTYGCPEYDLWGYDDVQKLEEDIVFERNKPSQTTERKKGCGRWFKMPTTHVQSEEECGEHLMCPECTLSTESAKKEKKQ